MSTWFTPPSMFVNEPADPEEGVSYAVMNFVSDVSYALYYGMVGTTEILKALEKAIRFVFPSDVALVIWDGEKVPDFRIPKQNYAWQRVKFMGIEWYSRLPNIKINGDWITWVQGAHIIEGSKEWDYYDPSDGTIKKGSEFDTPRGYSYLYDLWVDFGPVILIVTIGVILIKLGLVKVVTKMIQYFFKWNNRRKEMQNVDDEVAKVLHMLDGMHLEGIERYDTQQIQLNDIAGSLSKQEELLRQIVGTIGLRMRI